MIYLMRHGMDDERFIGGYSDVGLTDIGVWQVDDVGKWLMNQNFDIRKIYTSDIVRAVESANIVNKYLNLELYVVDIKLREQNKGLLNGIDRSIAEEIYSEYVNSSDINMKYPEGESLMDLYLRIKEFLLNISSYDNSLLVTHRGVINMIYYLCNDIFLDMNKSRYNVEHSSVHEFNIEKLKIRRIR